MNDVATNEIQYSKVKNLPAVGQSSGGTHSSVNPSHTRLTGHVHRDWHDSMHTWGLEYLFAQVASQPAHVLYIMLDGQVASVRGEGKTIYIRAVSNFKLISK